MKNSHNVTINSNIVTVHGASIQYLETLCAYREISQISLVRTGGTVSLPLFDMSYAMGPLDHELYAGQIHRYNAEQRAKNPHLEPKGPGPNGTPPVGGTPGAARVTKFENTVAIAA